MLGMGLTWAASTLSWKARVRWDPLESIGNLVTKASQFRDLAGGRDIHKKYQNSYGSSPNKIKGKILKNEMGKIFRLKGKRSMTAFFFIDFFFYLFMMAKINQ